MNEIFNIPARRCKRCGRILTSKEAISRGYGERCSCMAKKEEKEREPIPGQMTVYDWEKMMKGLDDEENSD